MNKLLAILNDIEPAAHGVPAHYNGFLFDTEDANAVQWFFVHTNYSNTDYCIYDTDKLKKNDVGNFMLDNIVIFDTVVDVIKVDGTYKYEIDLSKPKDPQR